MSKASLGAWLRHLESLHPTVMDLGLERVGRVARVLGLLDPAVPVITVAGTNGKGSTVAVLEALLKAAGLRPGCFTSPHFIRFNERIRIDGREVDDARLVAAFTAIESARGATSLTYFEFATLAALWIFREEGAGILVLEVGLGGRLDSVNIVDPQVSVITRIDLDHQEWLGDSREAIGREKAGIMRNGVPVVIADPDPPPSLAAAAEAVGATPVYWLGRQFVAVPDDAGWRGEVSLPSGGLRAVRGPATALLPINIAAALQAAAALGLDWSEERLQAALAALRLAGRRELRIHAGRQYLLDVAHNPSAIYKLLEAIHASGCKGKIIALFSVMRDKAVGAMLDPLVGTVDAWCLADQPDNARALPAAQIADLLRARGQAMISVSRDLAEGLARARQLAGPDDLIVVFGSFYTVAAVLTSLEVSSGRETPVEHE